MEVPTLTYVLCGPNPGSRVAPGGAPAFCDCPTVLWAALVRALVTARQAGGVGDELSEGKSEQLLTRDRVVPVGNEKRAGSAESKSERLTAAVEDPSSNPL